MTNELDYMTYRTDEQIANEERDAIAKAIEAIRAVAHIHGFNEDGLYDPDWMDFLDTTLHRLRYRDGDCLRVLRSVGK